MADTQQTVTLEAEVITKGQEELRKLLDEYKKLTKATEDNTEVSDKQAETQFSTTKQMQKMTAPLREVGSLFAMLNPKVLLVSLGLGTIAATLASLHSAFGQQIASTTSLGILIAQFTGQIMSYDEVLAMVNKDKERLEVNIKDIEAAYRTLIPTVWDLSVAQDILNKGVEIHHRTGQPLQDVIKNLNRLWKEGDFFMTEFGGKMMFGAEAVNEFHKRAMQTGADFIEIKTKADDAADVAIEEIWRELSKSISELVTSLKELFPLFKPLIDMAVLFVRSVALGFTTLFKLMANPLNAINIAKDGLIGFNEILMDMYDTMTELDGTTVSLSDIVETPDADKAIGSFKFDLDNSIFTNPAGWWESVKEGFKMPDKVKEDIETDLEKQITDIMAAAMDKALKNMSLGDLGDEDGSQPDWLKVLEDFGIIPDDGRIDVDLDVYPNFRIAEEEGKEGDEEGLETPDFNWNHFLPDPGSIWSQYKPKFDSGLKTPYTTALVAMQTEGKTSAVTAATGEKGFPTIPGDIWTAIKVNWEANFANPFGLEMDKTVLLAVTKGREAINKPTNFPQTPIDIYNALKRNWKKDLATPFDNLMDQLFNADTHKGKIDKAYQHTGTWIMDYVQPPIDDANAAISSLSARLQSLQSQIAAAREEALKTQDQSGTDPTSVIWDGPNAAEGGVVNRPTLLLAGEAGPEAIVPLDRAGGIGGSNVFQIVIDGRMVEEVVAKRMERKIRMRGAR